MTVLMRASSDLVNRWDGIAKETLASKAEVDPGRFLKNAGISLIPHRFISLCAKAFFRRAERAVSQGGDGLLLLSHRTAPGQYLSTQIKVFAQPLLPVRIFSIQLR